jgi:asparagine synthase (glutamine-hydrolysing)
VILRYLVVVRDRPERGPPSPGPGWTRAFAAGPTEVWTHGERSTGSLLLDGFLIGASARPVKTIAELAASWGGYVAVGVAGDVPRVIRDPTGRIPAWRLSQPGLHLVGSHVEDMAPFLDAPLEIDWPVLARTLLGDFLIAHRTALRSLEEVLPGEAVDLGDGAPIPQLVWNPAEALADGFRSSREARAALRSAAEESVAFWAARFARITLDLSGGLDSSAVLGLLARLPGRPEIVAINAVAGHAESDERTFARLAAAAAGVRLVEVDVGAAVPDYADGWRPPLQPRPTAHLRRTGLDGPGLEVAGGMGAQAYFTGRGGDHVFYDGVPGHAACEALFRRGGGLLRAAYDLARAGRKPLLAVLGESLRPPPRTSLTRLTLRPSPFLSPKGAALAEEVERLHPWVASAARASPAKIWQVCLLVELRRHFDRVGRAEVLEEVNPLISQPLLEASLRTPSFMFAAGGVRRGLQREVFADLMPTEVLARRTKGATTSHSIRTLAANLPWLREHLLEGELAREGLLDRTALESRLTEAALLDGRFRPALGECVSAQLWIEHARETLAGPAARPGQPPSGGAPAGGEAFRPTS